MEPQTKDKLDQLVIQLLIPLIQLSKIELVKLLTQQQEDLVSPMIIIVMYYLLLLNVPVNQ